MQLIFNVKQTEYLNQKVIVMNSSIFSMPFAGELNYNMQCSGILVQHFGVC